MIRNRHIAAAVLGGLVLVGSGCSDTAKSNAKTVRLAWMSKGACNTFFALSRSGATLAGQDLTSASGYVVSVTLLDPDDCTAAAAGSGGAAAAITAGAGASAGVAATAGGLSTGGASPVGGYAGAVARGGNGGEVPLLVAGVSGIHRGRWIGSWGRGSAGQWFRWH